MANARNTTSVVGIGYQAATYVVDNSTITYDSTKSGGSAGVGLAVKISADRTVALAGDGDKVEGKLITVEADNNCTVQYGGGMALPGGNGATLTAGLAIVGALNASSAAGYVKGVATTTANARGRIYNSATATAVELILE
jgi:hypothetical protein